MSDQLARLFQLLITHQNDYRGLMLALYLTLAIFSYGLAASRKRHPLTLLGLLMVFGLSSSIVARLLIPPDYWLGGRQVLSPELVIMAPQAPMAAVEQAILNDWSGVWPSVAKWQSEFESAASYCGVDPYLAAAVSARESSGNPNICSTQGACGLMGLMPGTAASLGVTDRLDPQENVLGGTCYLRQMLERYGRLDLALAAYNAGPGNVDKYGGIPPFSETKVYVRDVQKFYLQFSPSPPPPSPAPAALSKFPSAPVAGSYLITQGYHAGHPGLDIARFTTVVAVMDGVVRYVGPLYRSADGAASCALAGCLGRFGIVLDHGGGTFTVYGHNSCAYVQTGEVVQAGQALACIGSEGKSDGPHLHFELRVGEVWNGEPGWPWRGSYNSAIDPTSYLP